MATVKMKKGNKYADIFDSEETIAQAKSEGYELCARNEVAEATEEKAEENADSEEKTVRRGRTPRQ